MKPHLSDARTIEDGFASLSTCLVEANPKELQQLVAAGVVSLLADLLPKVIELEIDAQGGTDLLKYILGRLKKLIEEVGLDTMPSAELAVVMKRCVEILNDPTCEKDVRMPTLGLLGLVTEDKERYQTLFRAAEGMQCLLSLMSRHREDSSLVSFVLRTVWYACMDDVRSGHQFVALGGVPLLFEMLAAHADQPLTTMMGCSVLESITDQKLSTQEYSRGVSEAEAKSWLASHVESVAALGGIEFVMRFVQRAEAKDGAQNGVAFMLLGHLTRFNGDNTALQARIIQTPGLYPFLLSSLHAYKGKYHIAAVLTPLVREGDQDGETLASLGACELLLALFAESADFEFRADIVRLLARITRAKSSRVIIAASNFLPLVAQFFASACAQLKRAGESAGQEDEALQMLNCVTACCALLQNLGRDATCSQRIGQLGCIEMIVTLVRTHGAAGATQASQVQQTQQDDQLQRVQLLKYSSGALYSLAFESEPNAVKLRACDGVALMLNLLQRYAEDAGVVLSCAGCLHVLTVSHDSSALFVQLGGLKPLFSALRNAMQDNSAAASPASSARSATPIVVDAGLVQSLCGVLSNVGRDGALRPAVSSEGGVQILMSVIRRFYSHFGIVVNAVDALHKSCALDPKLLSEVRDAGGVALIIHALRPHMQEETFSKISLLLLFQLVKREGDDATAAKKRQAQVIELGLLALLDTVAASQKGKGSELEQLSTVFRAELRASQTK